MRNGLADALHAAGLAMMLRRFSTKRLVVLCYHRVLPNELRNVNPFPELAVTPAVFEHHLEECCRNYKCVPLREAGERFQSDRHTGKPLLTITFDDGYWDNFAHAAPILDAFGVRATFFVISSLVGSNTPPWYDQLGRALTHLKSASARMAAVAAPRDDHAGRWIAEQCRNGRAWSVLGVLRNTKKLPAELRAEVVTRVSEIARACGWEPDVRDRVMKRDELVRLAERGHEIASHTRSHPILTGLRTDELSAELEGSRLDLSTMLGEEIVSCAYPNGDYNDDVISAARRAGYRYAVTTDTGLNKRGTDPLRLRRVFISQERLSRASGEFSSNMLELELTGAADIVFLRRLRRRGLRK